MPFLFTLAAKLGIGKDLVKPFTYAALILAAIPVLMLLKSLYDSSVVESAVNEANVEALETQVEADGNASDDRLDDALELEARKDEINDILEDESPALPSDSGVRLACKQLLNSDPERTDFPAACGPRGAYLGDGT